MLTVLFGVFTQSKVTVYGVWRGKGGQAWQDEALEVEPRSPTVAEPIRRDVAILAVAE